MSEWRDPVGDVRRAIARAPLDYDDVLACICYPRLGTDGCTEWTCIYHGEENRRKQIAQSDACPVHGTATT